MSMNLAILRRGTILTAAIAALAWLAMAVAPAEAMRGGGGGHAGGGHMGGHFSGGHFGGHPGGYGGHVGGYAGARPGGIGGVGGVGGYGHAGAYGGYGDRGLGYGGYGGYGHGYAGYGGYGWGHPGYGYGYGGYGPFRGYGYGWGGFYNPYMYGYGYWPNVPSDYPTDQAYGAEYNENANDNQSTEEAVDNQNDGPQPDAEQYGNYGQYPGAQPPAAGGFTQHVDSAPNPKDQRPHDRGAIHIVVPNAYTIVSFDGQKMLGTGKDRLILTPTVEPGHDFKYQIQAVWTDASGKTVTQVREGVVQAGQYVVADFTKPQPEVTPTSASTPPPAPAPAKP